jgi:hypothetical protein
MIAADFSDLNRLKSHGERIKRMQFYAARYVVNVKDGDPKFKGKKKHRNTARSFANAPPLKNL